MANKAFDDVFLEQLSVKDIDDMLGQLNVELRRAELEVNQAKAKLSDFKLQQTQLLEFKRRIDKR